MRNREIIVNSLKEIHKYYQNNLYDFMQNEKHAQVQLFNELNKLIQGKVEVRVKEEDKNDMPIPDIVMCGSRVRLEVQANGYIHDICIVQDRATTIDETTIETVIEVKHGYGYCSGQTSKVASIGKDYGVLKHYYDNKNVDAHLVYFIGNSYVQQKENGQIEKYKLKVEEGVEQEIRKNNMFFVFTDIITNGNFKEIKQKYRNNN